MSKNSFWSELIPAFVNGVEQVAVHWELVSPLVYALLSSIGLLSGSVLIGALFSYFDPIVGASVFVILFGIALILSVLLKVLADLIIVDLSRCLQGGKAANTSLSFEHARDRFGNYLFVLAPVEFLRFLVIIVVSLPLVAPFLFAGFYSGPGLMGLSAQIWRFGVRIVSLLVNFVFSIAFIFLIQFVLFNKKNGFKPVTDCLSVLISKPGEMILYVLFRWLMNLFGNILVVLVVLFFWLLLSFVVLVFFPSASFPPFWVGSAGLLSAVLMIFLEFALHSVLLFMDTLVFFKLKPR